LIIDKEYHTFLLELLCDLDILNHLKLIDSGNIDHIVCENINAEFENLPPPP
jgi:hypothetical protein